MFESISSIKPQYTLANELDISDNFYNQKIIYKALESGDVNDLGNSCSAKPKALPMNLIKTNYGFMWPAGYLLVN